MAAIDFSKGINFTPLEQLGLSKEDSMKFLAAMAPMIDLEFQSRVKNAFNEEEYKAIGAEAESKGIKPEDGTFFLEEKYHAKTGRYFMEETRLLFNEYIVHAANIISKARADAQKFSGLPEAKEFDKLMSERKYEEAAKLMDETLRKTEPVVEPLNKYEN